MLSVPVWNRKSKERQMNSNWKINRVGLVDFWYYDDEEFVFDDGRMLLRGEQMAQASL